MNGEKMDRYIITDIGRVAARGEPLSDMCRLAFLEYFARNRDERGERVDLLIKQFGGGAYQQEYEASSGSRSMWISWKARNP